MSHFSSSLFLLFLFAYSLCAFQALISLHLASTHLINFPLLFSSSSSLHLFVPFLQLFTSSSLHLFVSSPPSLYSLFFDSSYLHLPPYSPLLRLFFSSRLRLFVKLRCFRASRFASLHFVLLCSLRYAHCVA
jgi:hypothetical protein